LKNSAKIDLLILAGLSLSLFLYHMLTGALSSYGFFIDEFYYIACSKHLALGYVDHPPLSIFLLALSRWLSGGRHHCRAGCDHDAGLLAHVQFLFDECL
jgi:hypothetical protein